MRIELGRTWGKAAFLVLCLLLGGASARGAGVVGNSLLQIIAAIIIAAGFWSRGTELSQAAKPLLLIFGTFLIFVLLSFIPLPASVWQALPGRDSIAQGYDLLGIEAPALPVTLSWQHSLASILWMLPPAAVFLMVARSSPRQRGRLVWVILGFCAISIVLGVAQLLGGENSPLRFYQITNPNNPVGFFSNSNHLATLLVSALPLAGYVAGRSISRRGSKAQRSTGLILATAIALFLLAGIGTIGSMAGYGLTLPAGLCAFLIYRKAAYGKVGRVWSWVAGSLFVIFLVFAIAGPLSSEKLSEEYSGDPASRAYFAQTTLEGIVDTFPVGSGLGTFQEVYRTHDDPNRVSHEYTNHAHNDYLEIVLELGAVGAILILAFLMWWLVRSFAVWRTSVEGFGLARAGSAIIFVVLLHSIVDYPLRTTAIGALFAFACALLVPYARIRANPAESAEGSLRHLKAD